MMAIPLILLTATLTALASPLACTDDQAVRNGGFEEGETDPTYWTIGDGGIRTHLSWYPDSYVIYGFPGPSVTQVLECVQPGVEYIFTANLTYPGFDTYTAPIINKASLDGVDIPLTQDVYQYVGTATASQQSPTLKVSSTIQTDNDLEGTYIDNVSLKRST